MSSATSTQALASSTLDPWTIPTQNFTQNNVAFFAGGSTVLGVIVLLIVCAVVRMRMVRRRRLVLGLPSPEALRRAAKNGSEELKPKPEIHDIWALLPEYNDGLENFPLQWEELHVRERQRAGGWQSAF